MENYSSEYSAIHYFPMIKIHEGKDFMHGNVFIGSKESVKDFDVLSKYKIFCTKKRKE